MESNSVMNPSELAKQLDLQADQVQRTVELLEDGNTIPFIARFRRQQTGGLDERQIHDVQVALERQRAFQQRKDSIIRSIRSRGQMTPELEERLQRTRSPKVLEDLYLPFKLKKQTRAHVARARGLEPLALEVLAGAETAINLEQRATELLDPAKGLETTKDVIDGIRDILIEQCSINLDMRQNVRQFMRSTGILVSQVVDEPDVDDSEGEVGGGDDVSDVEASTGAAGSAADEPADEDETNDAASHFPEDNESEGADESEPASESSLSDNAGNRADSHAEAHGPDDQAGLASDASTATEGPGSPAGDEQQLDQQQLGEQTPTIPDVPSGIAFPPRADASRQSAGPKVVEATKIAAPVAALLAARRARALERREKRKTARKRKRDKLRAAFSDYFNYRDPLAKIPPHRVLAVNRGERHHVLRVKIEIDQNVAVEKACEQWIPAGHPHAELLSGCVRETLSRLVLPSLEREIRRDMSDKAEAHALDVFSKNLRGLLLQPPVPRRVLAIDPAYRSGCQFVALDQFGNTLEHGHIQVIGNPEKVQEGRQRLVDAIRRHQATVVAIGNGTACRETEQLVSSMLAGELTDLDLAYVIVNEAGTSTYSTSLLAAEELPDVDPTTRSAISIGRRLLDPLSELVKIEPASLGIGMYQHDVKDRPLQESLDEVVRSCVNYVGVNLNTASPALLRYVSGLNQLTARRIYDYRREHGPFQSRAQLRDVPGIGESSYQQAAGFLMVDNGTNPLDATWIHPENYAAAEQVLSAVGSSLEELAHFLRAGTESAAIEPSTAPDAIDENKTDEQSDEPATTAETSAIDEPAPLDTAAESNATEPTEVVVAAVESQPAPAPAAPQQRAARVRSSAPFERMLNIDVAQTASQLGLGPLLVQDIVDALCRPGRDPRDDLPPPVFRRGIRKIDDLEPGMELRGTVLNVVDFGAFVDIGLAEPGLVHISRLADRYIQDPHEFVAVGDVLVVWVLEVDKRRRRVSLTAIAPGSEKPRTVRPPRPVAGAEPPQRREQRPPREPRRGGGPPHGRKEPHRPKVVEARKPPKPVKPITKGMMEGREPMRAFSDLLQFFEHKDPPKPKKGGKRHDRGEGKKGGKPGDQAPESGESDGGSAN